MKNYMFILGKRVRQLNTITILDMKDFQESLSLGNYMNNFYRPSWKQNRKKTKCSKFNNQLRDTSKFDKCAFTIFGNKKKPVLGNFWTFLIPLSFLIVRKAHKILNDPIVLWFHIGNECTMMIWWNTHQHHTSHGWNMTKADADREQYLWVSLEKLENTGGKRCKNRSQKGVEPLHVSMPRGWKARPCNSLIHHRLQLLQFFSNVFGWLWLRNNCTFSEGSWEAYA